MDTMDILNILIYEEELGISKNTFSPKKMRFLVKELGLENCIRSMDDLYFYKKAFMLSHKYKFHHPSIPDKELGALISMGKTKSDKISILNRLFKKIQKSFEIAYLNVHSDDEVSEYHEIFDSDENRYTKTIDAMIQNKKYLNDANILFNKELQQIRSVFENYNEVNYGELSPVLEKMIESGTFRHNNINDKLIGINKILKLYNENYSHDLKKKLTKIINLRITKNKPRDIVDIDHYKNDIIDQRNARISELNTLYGYNRYSFYR